MQKRIECARISWFPTFHAEKEPTDEEKLNSEKEEAVVEKEIWLPSYPPWIRYPVCFVNLIPIFCFAHSSRQVN